MKKSTYRNTKKKHTSKNEQKEYVCCLLLTPKHSQSPAPGISSDEFIGAVSIDLRRYVERVARDMEPWPRAWPVVARSRTVSHGRLATDQSGREGFSLQAGVFFAGSV